MRRPAHILIALVLLCARCLLAGGQHRHPEEMPFTFGRPGMSDQTIDDILAFLATLTDGYQP